MSEKFLMVDRRTDEEVEAEPVTVERTSKAVVFHLDDGEDLIFDADELREAVDA